MWRMSSPNILSFLQGIISVIILCQWQSIVLPICPMNVWRMALWKVSRSSSSRITWKASSGTWPTTWLTHWRRWRAFWEKNPLMCLKPRAIRFRQKVLPQNWNNPYRRLIFPSLFCTTCISHVSHLPPATLTATWWPMIVSSRSREFLWLNLEQLTKIRSDSSAGS